MNTNPTDAAQAARWAKKAEKKAAPIEAALSHDTIAWDGNNAYNKYEVIDDTTGSVLQTVKSYSEAFRIAQQRGISTKQISKAQLNRLRETGSLD